MEENKCQDCKVELNQDEIEYNEKKSDGFILCMVCREIKELKDKGVLKNEKN